MLTRMLRYLLAAAVSAATLFAAIPATVAAPTSYMVTSKDGVRLSVQESGNPNGPPVIFIHGLLGSRLNWEAQAQSPELRKYRIITYDLRGHGLSDKPSGATPYHDGRRWADDLKAVIAGSHARKPVVVGWSLGGAVISNYLATYGDGNIAGAVYVDGVVELAPGQIIDHPEVYRDMNSPDLKTHLDGERTFIGLCFNRRPDADTFSRLLANAALASWDMQKEIPTMTVFAAEALSKTRVPLLFIYGSRDALVDTPTTLARAKALNPRIQSKVYVDAGHAPFIEEPDRFNHDLAEFVRSVSGK
ncbi:dienelactone hydrolase family protein [Burkholderia ambifaria AMMD]|jgi:non-heme chloroperoxidase|uniref:Alpha/beta hydrolase fold protein n=1 Tax=Burkholderia ambifaria (strain ATCC BAA-244 / DSM 16087 / CCUG 44356 / LMG 19182 / AMMD) TaxID=339670 RepID=Q0B4W9_BURCM|nr:alpha/beta hydrolase [Burkholderia ambifaria]ABI90804.1 alpha/beta hydrolase fold protein [Burkholderia ambifaria AMMD]AJY23819.1 dienelactone hydrolase family protein [Burkholderia ambifaria AMMD]MBR7933008.1 alpha/beta hydrolase [Burkholderia ambifaria]PEH68809.1 alpha/beta hydrolase [Burkholderia ambifaria]QQC06600.1 alpha/beta hydrolase [Burkholderia ambifaria]